MPVDSSLSQSRIVQEVSIIADSDPKCRKARGFLDGLLGPVTHPCNCDIFLNVEESVDLLWAMLVLRNRRSSWRKVV